MTTDPRAALRDAANALARIGLRRDADLIASLRALADAPPTVAELLPRVDETHRAEWVDYLGRPCAASLVGAVVAFWWGPSYSIPCALRPSDLTQPATLAEVARAQADTHEATRALRAICATAGVDVPTGTGWCERVVEAVAAKVAAPIGGGS